MSKPSLSQQVEELRRQLDETNATLRAIRTGEVDAVVVDGPDGDQVYVLKGAEQPYRIFVETMSEGAVTLLRDGTIAYSNSRFAQMLQMPLEQVIGASLFSLLAPDYQDRLQPLLDRALQERCAGIVPLLPRGGTVVWADLSMCPVNLEQERGICLVASDVTERKKTEELRAYLASIVDSTEDAIIGKDLDGTILSWNHGAERLYGYSAEETIGRSISILCPPERAGEALDILQKIGRGESVERYETERVCKDGRRIQVSLTVSPLRDLEGRVEGASAIARDVTELKRSEAELARQAAELARSNAELQQFAYVASHDLQEPLRAVASFTKLLAERYQERLDSDADEFIAFAVDGARRAQRLIHDLLAYSRIGTRGRPFAATDCETVLQNVLADLSAALEDTGGHVTHDPLPVVEADETQLGQLFQNLIGNALKFHGTEPPCVHVSADPIPGAWRFSVRDNGIGIPPQFADDIFEVFRRLHTSAEYPGTGVGLAIAKKIVERHGGRIWVEPSPGGGSTFCFTVRAAERE